MNNILYVEDEVTVRLAMRFQLSGLGDVVEAANAQAAIDKITEFQRQGSAIDLAIIDLHLPTPSGFNADAGFEVVKQLEESFPETKSIILTIRNDPDAWRRAQQHPSVRYFFTKPAASDAIFIAARTCLPDCQWPIYVGEPED